MVRFVKPTNWKFSHYKLLLPEHYYSFVQELDKPSKKIRNVPVHENPLDLKLRKCFIETQHKSFFWLSNLHRSTVFNNTILNIHRRNFCVNVSQEVVSKENEEAKEKEKQKERQQRYMKYTLGFLGTLFLGSIGVALYEWGSPQKDENGEMVEDEFSKLPWLQQYVYRTWHALIHYNQVLREPSRELLLPPPLQPPYYQPPYTLVIELTGVLVHPDWTYKTGWRFKKRPYVDYLLQQCATSSLFEVVIFTKMQGFTAFPLLESLDPNQYIMYRLFRDSTRYENGVHIKDLTRLNRDLSKVIHLDCDKNACKLNPDNCLTFKEWDGDSNDRTLYDLANFLKAVAAEGVQDVRQVINHYSKFDDPLEAFRENQRKLAEQEKELEQLRQQQTQQQSSRSLLSSLAKKR